MSTECIQSYSVEGSYPSQTHLEVILLSDTESHSQHVLEHLIVPKLVSIAFSPALPQTLLLKLLLQLIQMFV